MLQLMLMSFIVVVASGLCSGSEAALLSLSLGRARQLAENGGSTAQLLLRMREDLNPVISTIVILNNIANIVGSIAVGALAAVVFGNTALGVFSAVLTLSIIIFGEIVPKTLGVRYNEAIALLIARPIWLLVIICTPAVWFVEQITRLLIRSDTATYTTNEAEIRSLVRIGEQEGLIEDDESKMIEQVFNLNDLSAGDLMTPRVRMTYLPGAETLAEHREAIIHSQHSRIIIIAETTDEVTGFALKDELLIALLHGKTDQTLASFQREIDFVAESERADKLLVRFRNTRRHIAVVVDEFYGVAGVVTLEDVLEILTGEIVDETDTVVDLQEDARRRWKQHPRLPLPGDYQ